MTGTLRTSMLAGVVENPVPVMVTLVPPRGLEVAVADGGVAIGLILVGNGTKREFVDQ